MKECALCNPNLGPVIAASDHWQLVLNRNQNLLGKCFLTLRRHLEAVPLLSPAEWTDLHQQLAPATEMLRLAFQPDHFNYAFLQNQDRHVHLHLIPRYQEPRRFADLVFEDPTTRGTILSLHRPVSWLKAKSQSWPSTCSSFFRQ